MILEWLAAILLAAGSGLLALNLAGRTRGVALYPVTRRFPPGQEGLGRAALLTAAELTRRADEPPSAYASRLVRSINRHMIHSAGSEFPLVSPFHNWILWALGLVLPASFRHWEFRNAKYALARGFGLCSQSALALADVLHGAGVEVAIVGLDGHVVATAEIEAGRWWVLDADYGVSLPLSIAEIRSDAEAVVRRAYGPSYGPDVLPALVKAYGGAHERRPYPSRSDSFWAACERAAFVVKWLFPMSMIGLGAWWLWCVAGR